MTEKDRDKKSCWEKTKSGWCIKKKSQELQEKAQATAQQHRKQQGKGRHSLPQPGQPLREQGCLVKQMLEAAFLGSQGHVFATWGPAFIGSGIKCPPQVCATASVILSISYSLGGFPCPDAPD